MFSCLFIVYVCTCTPITKSELAEPIHSVTVDYYHHNTLCCHVYSELDSGRWMTSLLHSNQIVLVFYHHHSSSAPPVLESLVFKAPLSLSLSLFIHCSPCLFLSFLGISIHVVQLFRNKIVFMRFRYCISSPYQKVAAPMHAFFWHPAKISTQGLGKGCDRCTTTHIRTTVR